ncbi:hypothetical protein SAMN00777080_3194 [Aquiflexum balticum DSM 16537]|uniref:Uncharacterized protein n=1 Tax=Aquiflexum balticum DSM 16537 TaxID=758820 RepID=A0A1W2H6J0_9BACT|nr:hypothetical protein SAMN00777080_3194 [Aquiflexum balticum DSM 16537]
MLNAFWHILIKPCFTSSNPIKEKLKMNNWCGSATADKFNRQGFVIVWGITKNYLKFYPTQDGIKYLSSMKMFG